MKVIKYANYWYVTLMQTPRKHEILYVHLKENFIIKTYVIQVNMYMYHAWTCHHDYVTQMNMTPLS